MARVSAWLAHGQPPRPGRPDVATVAADSGVPPPDGSFRSLPSSLCTWLLGLDGGLDLEPVIGFEPMACRLQDGCSAC
jgi:hypothetical protein